MLVGATVLLLSTTPTSQQVHVGAKSDLSINLDNMVLPCDSLRLGPTQLMYPSCFHWLFNTNGLPQLVLQTFLKSLKSTQTPNKHQLALVCSVPLAKRPQIWHKQQPVSTCTETPIRWLQAWHSCTSVCLGYSFNIAAKSWHKLWLASAQNMLYTKGSQA